jgi:molybdate transport system substrate-binding protein
MNDSPLKHSILAQSQFWAACLVALAAFILVACQPTGSASPSAEDTSDPPELIVFAAASTTNAIRELAALYETRAGVRITSSLAASSTLAKQIEAGAPADIFLSANPRWMDHLEAAGLLVDGTRHDLLGNRVVLIAPTASPLESVQINAQLNLSALLGTDGRLAMGDPAHVPAGLYGRQALESLGLWLSVADRIAPMGDVRAALTMVERGETPLGIVYATDAAISDRVKILGTFPVDTHPPVVYPIARLRESNAEPAGAFLRFLQSSDAEAIFLKYGFEQPDSGGSHPHLNDIPPDDRMVPTQPL